jgi:hypothetical protein
VRISTGTHAAGVDKAVSCDTNDIATGGGVRMTTVGSNNQEVQRSVPARNGATATDGQTPNGWIGTSNVAGFTVYVVCLDITP